MEVNIKYMILFKAVQPAQYTPLIKTGTTGPAKI